MENNVNDVYSNIIDEIIVDDVNDYTVDLAFYIAFNKRLHKIEMEILDMKIDDRIAKVTTNDDEGKIVVKLGNIKTRFIFDSTIKNGYHNLLKIVEERG